MNFQQPSVISAPTPTSTPTTTLAPTPATKSCTKILMLHGNGQSGDFFRCKTRFLQPSVGRTLLNNMWKDQTQSPSDVVEFHYLSGLLPADPDAHNAEQNPKRVWGYGEPSVDRLRGLERNIDHILRFLDQNGPFIGIMGFSAGAAIAAAVASLLEKRKSIGSLPFNANHPPLKFMVSFSGFPLENPLYDALYEPKIETPALHVLGTMDTMIEERQTMKLRDSFMDSSLHTFFGSHYVPRSGDFLEALGKFFTRVFRDEDEDDDWEDLDT